MADILFGKPVAEAITEDVKNRCAALKALGVTPSLAIVRVGEHGSQIAYENSAHSRCEKMGLRCVSHHFAADVTQQELLEMIHTLNRDDSVHGIIVLLPLPKHISSRTISNAIDPLKDVDGVTNDSVSSVFLGRSGFSPCAPNACMELLDYYGYTIEEKKVCVIGRSIVVGRPMAMLLLTRDATVTICHTFTPDLAAECRRADIVISAAGSPGLITADHVREGQILIDVGITADHDGKLRGDVDLSAVSGTVRAVTPVPGGSGVVAGAVLAKHVIQAAEKQVQLLH